MLIVVPKLVEQNVAINPLECRIRTPSTTFLDSRFASVFNAKDQMTQINAYLTFNGSCREAMVFYKGCFGGDLTLQTVEGSPMENQFPAEAKKKILHASLTSDRLVLLGSDMSGPGGLIKGNTISLSLNCSSEEEIKRFFSNLSSGGQVVHPLHEFFAGTMGTLTDKFEKDWLLYYEKKQRTGKIEP